ncbi:hypothetical protein [Palleronia sp.]|uniref:hypothetical protein n=1 Tax=Palleronia sp. TaxID=1940284 RepID=UPI0035C81A36
MSSFTGTYIVEVDEDGAIPLPPVWWLAALAGDPVGEPGPNLIVVPIGPENGEVLVTTLDRHILMVEKIRTLPEGRPERAALEVFAFEKCCAVSVTPDGWIPSIPLISDITGLGAGSLASLRGTGTGFRIRLAQSMDAP